MCRPDALVLLLGPSVPLTPVLFQAGVGALSGTRVDDPELVLRSVAEGATFRQIKRLGGLRLLTWLAAQLPARVNREVCPPGSGVPIANCGQL